MADFASKPIFVKKLADLLSVSVSKQERMQGYRGEVQENSVTVLSAIQRAIIETKGFVYNYGYRNNMELTALWHNVFHRIEQSNLVEELPKSLYENAESWGDPTEWLDSEETMELISKLDELNRKCEELLVELEEKY